MAQEFLGAGWKFSVDLVPGERGELAPGDQGDIVIDQGDFTLSQLEEKIQESIFIILSTAPGERLMRPEFGCNIHELVFAPNNASTAGLARFYVEEALVRWEPRIDIEEIEVQADPTMPALLLISISYRVRSTDSQFNVVYPFYLTREATVL